MHIRSLILAAVSTFAVLPGMLTPHATAPSVPYSAYTQMFAGANGFRGLFPGSPEYQWHHLDASHSDVVWGTTAWPGSPTGTNALEHFSVNGSWVELSGWDTTTDGVTGESPRYVQHVTRETSGNTLLDTSDGEEKYSYASLVPGETYSLQSSGYITQDNAPSVHLPFEHTLSWTVSADGTSLQQWEDWDQGSPLVESPSYPRVAVLTAGQGFTYLSQSNGWSSSQISSETW